MRTARSIRNRGRRKKIQALDIDITSLLDILVILLVFLLKSYDSTSIILNVPKEIKLPTSASSNFNTEGVNIQVSNKVIWVDDKVVLERKNGLRPRYSGNRRIISLYNELVRKKQIIKQVEKSSPHAKKFSGIINLIVDKKAKYSMIKNIMYTAAEAGYKEYKFVVRGENP